MKRTIAIALLALAVACGSDGGDTGGTPVGPPSTNGAGVPGFDIGVYPGDAAVRAWATASPYKWVGYYLPAPCHRDSSFVGKRGVVNAAGLGVAVLYVGQQTWDGVAVVGAGEAIVLDARADRMRAMASAATCSRTLLDAAQGDVEARDAIARTAAEGFPIGTVIYLDLEPMTITAAMRSYYTAWASRVTADGRYRPGIYAHWSNASAIHADVPADVPFWIARTTGFSLQGAATGSGFAFARAWQGALDVSRTWGGVTLRVDESVADRKSPS